MKIKETSWAFRVLQLHDVAISSPVLPRECSHCPVVVWVPYGVSLSYSTLTRKITKYLVFISLSVLYPFYLLTIAHYYRLNSMLPNPLSVVPPLPSSLLNCPLFLLVSPCRLPTMVLSVPSSPSEVLLGLCLGAP